MFLEFDFDSEGNIFLSPEGQQSSVSGIGYLIVEQDRPFTRIYRIDYLNMSRTTTSSVDIATQIASTGSSAEGGGGGPRKRNRDYEH